MKGKKRVSGEWSWVPYSEHTCCIYNFFHIKGEKRGMGKDKTLLVEILMKMRFANELNENNGNM